ncbi:hypothetical protein SDC9_73552 [bioreactor metagenome]|uniref:Uncharacterized protein n=1 Tax=bioreactor metagenome TaxID=1076179 RepID=A0A644YFL3_9ZZZZ
MVVGIHRFGEYRVLNRNIHRGQFKTVTGFITIVHVAVDRHVFVQPPTCRTVVNHNVTHRIATDGIVTESYILRSTTETHVSDNHVMCIDQERSTCKTYTIARSRLSGNGYVRCTQMNGTA